MVDVAEPLFEEPPGRGALRALSSPSTQDSWKVLAHRLLRVQSRRFDGRQDMVGDRAMRYLTACALALDVTSSEAEYVVYVTRVRITTIRQLLTHGARHRRTSTGNIGVLQTVAVIRDLHNKIVEQVENINS